VSTALRGLLSRHADAATIPGAVALLGGPDAEVVAAGVASIGGGPMREDAIMRIQSMTKVIASVAALRLVAAGRLNFDQSVLGWLPELADRRVLRTPTAALDDTVPACRDITLRHLWTSTCGYGMVIQPSPLQQATGTPSHTQHDELRKGQSNDRAERRTCPASDRREHPASGGISRRGRT
jgi:CubicO group peptidase (beta-lactamase class C family)